MREFHFYIVPTPIGNIQDITFRAVEVLKSVDLIACEDTRVTQKLLNHYDIGTKCISYHKYNERERVEYFLQELGGGKKIALVSDAGTPMICDPGTVIVQELTNAGYSVTSLPGACAVTTFLSQIPRELSKLFEEVITDKVSAVIEHFAGEIKGEIVCMVHREKAVEDFDIANKIKVLKAKGFRDKEISVILAELCGLNKNDVYKKSLEL